MTPHTARVVSAAGERMGTVTLTEFLLERITEDEAEARAVKADLEAYPPSAYDAGQVPMCDAGDPARVLAECEAKLEMIEVLAIADAMDQGPDRIGTADHLLRTMASVYADHPGYREEWR